MRDYKPYTILSAKAATGAGLAIQVKDFRHIIVALSTASSANLTVKAAGSIQESIPDFDSAQSASNMWDYMQMVDYQDGAKIAGDTGVAFTGTDDVRLFELNTNGLEWVNFIVTARAAGSVTVKILAITD